MLIHKLYYYNTLIVTIRVGGEYPKASGRRYPPPNAKPLFKGGS